MDGQDINLEPGADYEVIVKFYPTGEEQENHGQILLLNMSCPDADDIEVLGTLELTGHGAVHGFGFEPYDPVSKSVKLCYECLLEEEVAAEMTLRNAGETDLWFFLTDAAGREITDHVTQENLTFLITPQSCTLHPGERQIFTVILTGTNLGQHTATVYLKSKGLVENVSIPVEILLLVQEYEESISTPGTRTSSGGRRSIKSAETLRRSMSPIGGTSSRPDSPLKFSPQSRLNSPARARLAAHARTPEEEDAYAKRKEREERVKEAKKLCNGKPPAWMTNVQTFVRVDNSIEGLLDVKTHDESLIAADKDLWKILLPVVRVNLKKPSQDHAYIRHIEPSYALADLSAFTCRPPAIPIDLPAPPPKWYTHRVAMAMDKSQKDEENQPVALRDKQKRQLGALGLAQRIERKVVLNARKF